MGSTALERPAICATRSRGARSPRLSCRPAKRHSRPIRWATSRAGGSGLRRRGLRLRPPSGGAAGDRQGHLDHEAIAPRAPFQLGCSQGPRPRNAFRVGFGTMRPLCQSWFRS